MKEGKNTFKHELSTRQRKNRLLKTASKDFVHTLKPYKDFVHTICAYKLLTALVHTCIKPCVHTKKNT